MEEQLKTPARWPYLISGVIIITPIYLLAIYNLINYDSSFELLFLFPLLFFPPTWVFGEYALFIQPPLIGMG